MTALRQFLVLALVTALTACGGGGGSSGGGGGSSGGGGSDDSAGGDSGLPDNISGRAVKGIIRDADVIASVWDGSGWVQLDVGRTDDTGHFSLGLETPQSAPVKITVEAVNGSQMRCDAPSGCGDATFGDWFDLSSDFRISTIVSGSDVQDSATLAVTPQTAMAAAFVESLPRGVTDAGVELAHDRVADLFGLPSDYALALPVDVTSATEVTAAGDTAVQHGIFAAAFAELAASETLALEGLTTDAATLFGLLGGQTLNLSGEVTREELEQIITDLGGDPQTVLDGIDVDRLAVSGLDSLIAAAQAVGNQINSGGALDSLLADLPDLSSRWESRVLTALGGGTSFDSSDFNRALVPLDDYDHYHDLAVAGDAMVDATNRNLGWLYADETARTDTEGLTNVIGEALSYSLDAAICVPQRKFALSCNVDAPYANLVKDTTIPWTGHLEISGSRHGQTVDLTISEVGGDDDLDIRDFLKGGTLPLGIVGTIDNGTAETTLDIVVTLDITDNDLSGFNSLSGLDFADAELLNPLLEALADDLSITVSLSGSGSIAGTDESVGTYSFSNLDSSFSFNRRVITQDEDAPLISVAMDDGERTNPAGEDLFTDNGGPAFQLILGDPASVSQSYGFDRLNLPGMSYTLNGELSGLTPVLETLGTYFDDYLNGEVTLDELDINYDALLADLDLGLLGISGSAGLEIDDTDRGLREYSFTLNNGAVEISSPNSTDTAMTLYRSGLAGYLYADDTLVSTVHLGNSEDGVLLSLVNDTQRRYPREDNGEGAQLENLFLLLESLLGSLFETESPA
jgi:hypothetical protein